MPATMLERGWGKPRVEVATPHKSEYDTVKIIMQRWLRGLNVISDLAALKALYKAIVIFPLFKTELLISGLRVPFNCINRLLFSCVSHSCNKNA